MNHSQGWSGWSLGLAVLSLAVYAGNISAQTQMTIQTYPPTTLPDPALVNEPFESSLFALVQNPPSTAPYTCMIQGPSWQWTRQTVTQNGAPPQAPYDLTLSSTNNSDPTLSGAFLSGSFGGTGSWSVTCGVQVVYTDSPCSDLSMAAATITVTVNVVDVQLSPNPLIVPVGGTAYVTVTTTPSGYESDVSVSSADSSIASVNGFTPSYMVSGVQAGSTNLLCTCWGRPVPATCPVYVFTANLKVNGITGAAKLNPGAYVPLNANNDNGSTVTNGVPATRDMNTNPIPNEEDLVPITLSFNGSLPNPNWPVT